MQLSKNFTLGELTRSSKANQYKIDNTPSPSEVINLKRLATNVLQPIREAWKQPIAISSGYRCSRLNRIVKESVEEGSDLSELSIPEERINPKGDIYYDEKEFAEFFYILVEYANYCNRNDVTWRDFESNLPKLPFDKFGDSDSDRIQNYWGVGFVCGFCTYLH